MMTEEQRAAALAMLGGGAAQQAGQQVSAPNRMQQLQQQEAAAMGQQPPMDPRAAMQRLRETSGSAVIPNELPQQLPPGVLQRILMMLRGQGQ